MALISTRFKRTNMSNESRKTKRRKQKNQQISADLNLLLKNITPKTQNQSLAFDYFNQNKNLLLHGLPGTGKTFIAMYLAFKELEDEYVDKVHIIRSAVPTRDMGFMPGKLQEKAEVYEYPYTTIAAELYGRGDAYQYLKNKNKVSFSTTSFIRGITLDNCIIIIDESQNMSYHELSSIITRMGSNARIIICGDVRQDDLTSPRFKEVSGLGEIMKILQTMNKISAIEFDVEDIVRSDFVKDFIVAKDNYERKTRYN